MSRLILTIITIALFALRGECVMDARMFMYDHLGIEDGMLSQRVHSIVEDSNGEKTEFRGITDARCSIIN